MKKIFVSIFSLCVLSLGAWAQHETIVVTNTYEPTVPEMKKAEVPMAVPDSLLRFDLDYNYSVFDNPYQGSYEFNPYLIGIEPEKSDERKYLYLKAGAGYTLRPTLDLVWSPRSRYGITLTARHDSYFGDYRNFTGGGLSATDGSWKGHDMQNGFSLSGQYAGDDWRLKVALGYDGIAAKDPVAKRQLHGTWLRAEIGSSDVEAPFFWQSAMQYRYSRDDIDAAALGTFGIDEADMRFDGSFGPVLGNGHRVLVDIGMEVAQYAGGTFRSHSGLLTLTPSYRFETGLWRFSLGAEVSTIIRQDRSAALPGHAIAEEMHTARWRLPIPVASVSYGLLPEALTAYVACTGGATVNTWTSLVARDHFRLPFQSISRVAPIENSYETLRAALGVRGRILHRFSYDLSGGYARAHNALVDAWQPGGAALPGLTMTYAYSDFDSFFADLKYDLHAGGFATTGIVSFRNARMDADEARGRGASYFAPAHFSGNLRLSYTWRERIRGGVSGVFETRRKAVGACENDPALDLKIPGWLDLGVDAGYVASRRLSFWLRGGNLLGQTIQTSLLHAEKGPYIQGGIILQL